MIVMNEADIYAECMFVCQPCNCVSCTMNYLWVLDKAKKNLSFVTVTLWISIALGDYRKILHKISVTTFLTHSNGGDMHKKATVNTWI